MKLFTEEELAEITLRVGEEYLEDAVTKDDVVCLLEHARELVRLQKGSRTAMNSTDCPRCVKRGKTWNGSEPRCGFPNGRFTPDNWGCATLNDLRNWIEEQGFVSHAIADENLAVYPIEWCDDGGSHYSGHLVMAWYKRRGTTGQLVFMDSDTLDTAVALSTVERFLMEKGR